MKKIVLNEKQIVLLKEDINDLRKNKLPPYVYDSVKKHDTSLGESPAFPPSNDYDYDYKILKVRFNEIINTLDELQLPKNEEEAENLLYKLMRKAVDMEKPFREQLNKLAYNTVYKMFAVPPETINLTCELVDEVSPRNALRIVPEDDSEGDAYTFNDVEEINKVSDIVKQRRFINSLIQGYALIMSTDYQLYNDFFEDKGLGDLIDLYEKINALNDYLTFVKKEKIDKKKQSLISYVEVHLGHRDEKTIIKSQGLIFPYLLRETVRGFMELFASHGLPKDNTKAQSIVSLSDFTMAEPWDIRFGKVLWDKMFTKDIDSTKIPYLFADYTSLSPKEFFDISQNILANTKKGKEYVDSELKDIDYNTEYNKFLDTIHQKNIETSMINDGYMTSDDLDNYTIEEEGNLEENSEDEMIGYHGTSKDFDKFNHRKYINQGTKSQTFGYGTYITSDKMIAQGYSNATRKDAIPKFKGEDLRNEDTFMDVFQQLTDLPQGEISEIYETFVDKKFDLNETIEDYISYYKKYQDEDFLNDVNALKALLNNNNFKYDEQHAFLYEVEIPNDNGENYIDWYDYFPPEKLKEILIKLFSLPKSYLINLAEKDVYFGRLLQDFYHSKNPKKFIRHLISEDRYETFLDGLTMFDKDSTGSCVYKRLAQILGSQRDASTFLMNLGYDGIKYEAGTILGKPEESDDDAENYVIFNANKIKIINKTIV